MKDFYAIVGSNLRILRLDKRISLQTAADYIGKHRETIRRYESSAENIDIKDLIGLLNLYNVNISIFFEECYGKMP